MYNHNKAQQSKNRVHVSWDILYDARPAMLLLFITLLFFCRSLNVITQTTLDKIHVQ